MNKFPFTQLKSFVFTFFISSTYLVMYLFAKIGIHYYSKFDLIQINNNDRLFYIFIGRF